MQTINICITVPDGVQFSVNAVPATTEPTPQPVPTGPTDEQMRLAFQAAVTREKKVNGGGHCVKSFAALGYGTCKEVPAAEYGAVIERCNAVAK